MQPGFHAGREALSAELEQALVRELQGAWEHHNWSLFQRRLEPVLIGLSGGERALGRWVPEHRAIEISRAFAVSEPWGRVVEVLKHEMAHQYVDEVLGVRDESSHGPMFRRVCEERGIDRGAATPVRARDDVERITDRIAKLLALAERAGSHEAEAAMAAARKLMLRHNLEAAASGPRAGYRHRHLGTASGRVGEAERVVGAILGRYFFVQVIWVSVYLPLEGRRGSVLEVCGTPENLQMAEYVHAFLFGAAERAWASHKVELGIRANRDRRRFVAGVMSGFLEKLERERKKDAEAGLVWVRDADLDAFFAGRHPRVRTVKYGGSARDDAHHRGREAGRNLELHRPFGGAQGAPRLLGPKRGA